MQVNLDLSTAALRKLLRGQTVQLKHDQIGKGSPIYIPEFYHALSKAYASGKGIRISLSKESQDENIRRHSHIRSLLPKKRVAELVREEEEEYDGDVVEGGRITTKGVGRAIKKGFEDFGKKLNTARVPLARVAAAVLPTVAAAVEAKTGLPTKSLTKGLAPVIDKSIDKMERQQKRNTAKRKAAKLELEAAPEPVVATPDFNTPTVTGDPTQDPAMQISGGRIRAVPHHNTVNKPVLFYQPVKQWKRGGALYPPDR